jgi:hypothetical protein
MGRGSEGGHKAFITHTSLALLSNLRNTGAEWFFSSSSVRGHGQEEGMKKPPLRIAGGEGQSGEMRSNGKPRVEVGFDIGVVGRGVEVRSV